MEGIEKERSLLRHLLFTQIEKVEVNLRCRVANYFSCTYGVPGYKDACRNLIIWGFNDIDCYKLLKVIRNNRVMKYAAH